MKLEYLLTDVLQPSALSSATTPASLASHTPFLPPSLAATSSTLSRIIHSRELKRSVASLDRALRTGALGPLVQGLGLGPESAEGVEAFLQGIQEQADRETAKESGDIMETD
jgi:26S proteasome regulatory subunit N13